MTRRREERYKIWKRTHAQPENSAVRWGATCDRHGKRLYLNKRAAKAAIRQLHDSGMRAYRCTVHEGWHIGHNAPEIMRGEVTAREVYPR